jgi:hypothetical protein
MVHGAWCMVHGALQVEVVREEQYAGHLSIGLRFL